MLMLLVIFFTFVSAMIVYREMNSLIAQDMVSKDNMAYKLSLHTLRNTHFKIRSF